MARAVTSISRTTKNASPNPHEPPEEHGADEHGGGGDDDAVVRPSSSSRPTLDLESLPRLTFDELRRLWSNHMGRAKCPVQKRILIRELAWRYQERLYGGLDAETKRLLEAAVRAAIKRCKLKAAAVDAPESAPPSRRSPVTTPAKRTLRKAPAGARLVRAWPPGSKTLHEVHVLDGGKAFEYQGTKYKSLSEIARLITGTRWSGPRFFGLVGRGNGQNGGAS